MKLKGMLVILADIVVFGVVLLGFAYLHHGKPEVYEPIAVVTTPAPKITKEPELTPTPEVEDEAEITPEPTPVVYPTGNFTATFPDYDTGEGALISVQNSTKRIAVNMVQENNVTYFVADIWVKNIECIRTAFAGGSFTAGVNETVRKMAGDNYALLAVSGDFCGAHKSGVVIRNGILYREKNGSKEVCVLYYDGTMKTYSSDEFSLDEAVAVGAWQAWSFGPHLLEDGKARAEIDSKIGRSNPRCAIGYYEPGHYCFVVVDGRQRGYSEGMTLEQLSSLMESLGCVEAYNMDGGATAEMVYEGERVSSPSDEGRRSSDIIYITGGSAQ